MVFGGLVMKQPRKYDYRSYLPEKIYFEYLMRNDELEEIKLTKEEMEAINLKDVKGYTKRECSKKMGISRKNFQILIEEARKKISRALIEGKSIKLILEEEVEEEDLHDVKACKFRCAICGYIYYVNYEYQDIVCPKCNSRKVMSSEDAGFSKKWSYKK